jgi:hypothetical protein
VVKPPFYPSPPPKGASRLERLCFLRKNYFYGMALLVPVLLVGAIFSFVWILVACGIALLVQLSGLASLERQIRAERDRAG